MPGSDPHARIARKLRSIEATKVDLLEHVAAVHRAVQSGSERDIARSLAQVAGTVYLLGAQIGIMPQDIDRMMHEWLARVLPKLELEPDTADFFARYIQSKR
ncbi:hypothetical protein GCM10010885_00950 [Alicyclobacillus cellulosilyticus]|uniref:MazG-like nucleotide pyrophosphohydrolase family protein n=1 Tax=Alicyclobacillus cellulosilyticus TaxID=1003997 RepID=A0A917K045_9BACL|nr:MazG-like family protein [Alicyclobacillus cellulosilyticus]GGI95149.1 hypothetical protein GCM10010885_00950 [Alicyclobacillus cellulosilyticus]